MDNLSTEQYESILKYMEVANEEDFTKASGIMAKYAYHFQNAINGQSLRRSNIESKSADRFEQQFNQEQQMELQRNFRNYVSYLRDRNQPTNFIKSLCGKMQLGVKKFCSSCSRITVPFLHQRFFGKEFKNIYRLPLSVKVSTQLQNSLDRSKRQSKPCLIILSSQNISNCLLQFMRNDANATQINKYFEVVGLVQGSVEAVTYQQIMNQHAPSLIFCRKDITKRLNVFRKYYDQAEIMAFQAKDIQQIVKQFQRLQRKDVSVVRRFNHRLNLSSNQFHVDQEDQNEFQHFQGIQNSTRRQSFMSSSMIQQQNQVYKQIEKQAMKKRLREEEYAKKLQQQKKNQQQVQQQRKLRKMSIPDQPTQGDIARLSFRCPDGQIVKRNFLMDQQLQLVYNWVQTNQEIEFENDKSRNFQLLAFYPPVSLRDRKAELLRNVFEDGQQKIMIREI